MRVLLGLALSAALAIGVATLPDPVAGALGEAEAAHDPVARADLQLAQKLTPERLSLELQEALDKDDQDLAASLVELGEERGLSVSPEQKSRLEALRADHSPLRAARAFGSGFVNGDTTSGLAMSGAIAADLSGYGDVRELAREGARWLAGGETDMLVLGLSAAGLAVTAATWSSLGAALPARGGFSVLKAMQKTGRLSKPLASEMTGVAHAAIDSAALRASLAAVGRLDLAAARQASASLLRPRALASFRQFGADVSVVYERAGARGAQDVLSVAATRAEVGQAARIAAAKGSKTRAVLKVLGRGVLMAGGLSLTAFSWLVTAMLYLLAAASLARKFSEVVGRALWSAFRSRGVPHDATRQSACLSALTQREERVPHFGP